MVDLQRALHHGDDPPRIGLGHRSHVVQQELEDPELEADERDARGVVGQVQVQDVGHAELAQPHSLLVEM